MDSKRRSRRGFLKDGAAVAGLAVGAIGTASAQPAAPDANSEQHLKELIAYGERSHYVTSVRLPSVGEASLPDPRYGGPSPGVHLG